MSFPSPNSALTHILVVRDLAKSIEWYRDVLGASLVRDYGGTSAVFSFNGAWLLIVTPGGTTPDKPDVHFDPPSDPNQIAHAMTIRVDNCTAAYQTLRDRGADFITPPIDNGPETRCFFRDPDGHLFEISEFRSA